MNISLVEKIGSDGTVRYMLEHDYDTDIFTDLPSSGPFRSRVEAEVAGERLSDALACVND